MSDAGKIAAAFHRRAAEYDRHVAVQKRVVNNLAVFVETHLDEEPDTILDVGTGTGALLHNLRRIYPEASLSGVDLAYNMCLRTAAKLGSDCLVVNGDAEKIPFKSAAFDLAVSTSALQWVQSLSHSLHEMRRVLKPGGTLCIAFFSEGTLGELQRCFRDAARKDGDKNRERTSRLHRFWSVDDVKLILEGMDFEQVILSCETEKDWYDDVTSLLRSIKSIGAGAIAGGSATGLGWRGIINETSRLYREYYGQDGRIPATYEVLYIYARTPSTSERIGSGAVLSRGATERQ
ncbi:MAG: methyltransferase domain-containing protein [Desulfuromonadaceae bacterium]|nr:methyltransferase domain-containing protein [Desulfuromonadaceae bacterium]